MKITKEKVEYFFGLILIPFLMIILISFIFILFGGFSRIGFFKSIYGFFTYYGAFILSITTTILLAGVVAFIYAYKKRNKKYNIFICALFVGLILPVQMIFHSLLLLNLRELLILPFIVIGSIFYYIPLVIVSLIILKITDPLRKKIKW
ncbi:MAG: hypothetical protein KAT32_04285 [Candidatus Moranbacteria bacterium]|nr:hypothetical protein [Candidatus Moranbacteria bacterium]